MEKTVFKMLAVTGVVIGLGIASLPLSSFAADDPVLPEYTPKEAEGNMEVNVVVSNHIALDTENTAFHGGYLAGGDSARLSTNSMVTPGLPSAEQPNPKTGLWTGIESTMPYQISISSTDPRLVHETDSTEAIPSSADVKAGTRAWAIMSNKLKAGQTGANGTSMTTGESDYEADTWLQVKTVPQVFQKGPATRDTTDGFVGVRFAVGISSDGSLAPGDYSGDVTITAAAQP